MLKLSLKILSQAKSRSNQGFTILEAVAAMLIALGFVLASLQAIVLATAFRVKAQEKQLATQLIQEEIENIKWIANTLDCDGTCGNPPTYNTFLSRCTSDSYNNGYANALWLAYSTTDTTNANYNATFNAVYDAIPNKTIAGSRQIGLRRTIQTASSTTPHKILRIEYEVRDYDGMNLDLSGDPIATDYLEITPNAALQCP